MGQLFGLTGHFIQISRAFFFIHIYTFTLQSSRIELVAMCHSQDEQFTKCTSIIFAA